jgi:hypothetical protein
MFAVGQRVWRRAGGRSGTVLECYGDQVAVRQDNGAEMDFPASDLTGEPPSAGPAGHHAATVAQGAARALPARVLTPRDITPAHTHVLSVIPVRTLQAVAAVYERGAGAGRFSALDPAGKLNAVAQITCVPYRVMQQYSDRPGELGLLMGKGLADSSKAPTPRHSDA